MLLMSSLENDITTLTMIVTTVQIYCDLSFVLNAVSVTFNIHSILNRGFTIIKKYVTIYN